MKSSPHFKIQKRNLVRDQFPSECMEIEEIDLAFSSIKKWHNLSIESLGNQPDTYSMFCQVLSRLNKNNVEISAGDISSFMEKYNKLFITYSPSLIGGMETSDLLNALNEDGHSLMISSNTLFVGDDVWVKVLANAGILHYFKELNFSSAIRRSKPDKKMFEFTTCEKVDYHIGDNPVTDGSCEKYGIQFYQVNSNNKTLKDFYDEKIVFSSSDLK